MFGITFDGHPDLRRILMPEEFTAFPLRKDYPLRGRGERHNFPRSRAASPETVAASVRDRPDVARPAGPLVQVGNHAARTCSTIPRCGAATRTYLWTLNFGPQHPATHTTLRLVLTLDGETVVKAVPDIGYLHSRLREARRAPRLQPVRHHRRPDELHLAVANEIAWHHAVEKLLGIELTPRCKYIRVDPRRAGADQRPPALHRGGGARPRGVHGVPLRLQPAREDLRHLRDAVGPAVPPQLHPRRRVLYDVDDRVDRAGPRRSSRASRKALADMERLLNRNRIFVDRTQGRRRADEGRGDQPAAAPGRSPGPAAWSATCARTSRTWRTPTSISRSSVATSGRLLRPLPGPHGGDASRACRIIEQAIENLPGGPVNVRSTSKVAAARQGGRCTAASRG